MRFFEEKVHSLSVAPEPLAIWNKELEGLDSELFQALLLRPRLESELFKGLKAFPIAAPEYIPRFFYSKRTRIQDLDMFSDSLLLSDVVVWWWLSVIAFCSWVVLCWYILPNMLISEYCSLSSESSIIEPCLFTVSFVRLVSLVLLVHVHRSFDL